VLRVSGDFLVLADGTELYARRQGSGPPLVLVHGLFGLVEHWRFQLPVFERDLTVVAYDLRGSGRSSKPAADAYAIVRHAGDLAEALDLLAIGEPAVVVGHSMGSCVALELALSRPERVRGLVLVDGFSCGEHCLVGFEQMRESVARKRTLVPLFKQVSFGETFQWHPEGDAIATWCAEEACKLPLEAIYASARGFSAYDARERLGELAVPTLVLVGDQDWSCPLDPSSRFLAERIAGAALEVLRCGHFPMLEVAEQFNASLATFLRERVGLTVGTSTEPPGVRAAERAP
jgi:pimeloyl-ACP methyl ester carboxylesterase